MVFWLDRCFLSVTKQENGRSKKMWIITTTSSSGLVTSELHSSKCSCLSLGSNSEVMDSLSSTGWLVEALYKSIYSRTKQNCKITYSVPLSRSMGSGEWEMPFPWVIPLFRLFCSISIDSKWFIPTNTLHCWWDVNFKKRTFRTVRNLHKKKQTKYFFTFVWYT